MKKWTIVVLHILYWILYLSIVSTLFNALNYDSMMMFWIIDQAIFTSQMGVAMILPAIIAFYLSYYLLFKNYYVKRQPAKLILLIILISLLNSILTLFVAHQIPFKASLTFPIPFMLGHWHLDVYVILTLAILSAIHGILGLVTRGFIRGFTDMKEKAELKLKNSETELALLKARINPHFLFNTINNIDVLIQKDPNQASQYLNKLSQMMRFMLYETDSGKIDLSEELNYIQSYVELQKIRTTNPNFVSYEVKGEAGDLKIEPMLFIPFIENAFKHSENKKLEDAVSIFFNIEKDRIRFECKNAYSRDQQLKPEHSGLGNELIHRRLALLYPNKYTFEVNDSDLVYKVALSIYLK